MKTVRYFAIMMSLALAMIACQLFQPGRGQPAQPTSTAIIGKDSPTETAPANEEAVNVETEAPEKDEPKPVERPKPKQSNKAEIRPEGMRLQLTHLSSYLGYRVLDENGELLGIASDYVVNTCETYIIYILMEPADGLEAEPGERIVIPFEAVTVNSGVLDAENKAIQLRLIREQFAGAPRLPVGQPLTPTGWEAAVRDFWSKAVRIGKLATSCNVPGGPVYKVAYATELLEVELYDGRKNLLGVVQEAILEPESGKIGFFIVKPAEGDGLVLLHLRAVNIPKEALAPGGTLTLVLTSDPQVFWNAPRMASADEADDYALQGKMRRYWDR